MDRPPKARAVNSLEIMYRVLVSLCRSASGKVPRLRDFVGLGLMLREYPDPTHVGGVDRDMLTIRLIGLRIPCTSGVVCGSSVRSRLAQEACTTVKSAPP